MTDEVSGPRNQSLRQYDRRLAPRSTFGLLVDPLFGPYFFARTLSTAGVWVFNIVAAIVVFELTRSTLLVGAVSTAMFVPQLLFAPASGAQADRREPKTQVVAGRLLVMAAAGGLGLVMAVGSSGPAGTRAWAVIVAAGIVGLGFVVGGPAQHSLLPALVRPAELTRAVALNSLPPTVARAAGPVVGVGLLVAAGPSVAFGFTAITALAFAAVVASLPLEGRIDRADEATGTVRAGFRYLCTEPLVACLLLGMLGVGFGADPVVTLTPALAAQFGGGEQLVGWFASAFGTGAVVSYLAVGAMTRWRGLAVLGETGLGLLAAGTATAGLAPTVPIALTGMAIAGVGFSFAMTGLTTQLYERVPEELRGRIMAIWSMGFIGSRPVAAMVSGAVADTSSIELAFALVAVTVAFIGVTTRLWARHQHRSAT